MQKDLNKFVRRKSRGRWEHTLKGIFLENIHGRPRVKTVKLKATGKEIGSISYVPNEPGKKAHYRVYITVFWAATREEAVEGDSVTEAILNGMEAKKAAVVDYLNKVTRLMQDGANQSIL